MYIFFSLVPGKVGSYAKELNKYLFNDVYSEYYCEVFRKWLLGYSLLLQSPE